MKLMRLGEIGYEEPAVMLDDGRIIDASTEFGDYNEAFLSCSGLEALQSWIESGCPGGIEKKGDYRIGAPIARPSKIICVGQNYADHAREFGAEVPPEPVIFMKATTAYNGPFDQVEIPPGATKLDYEVELAVVMGMTAKRISQAEARSHIAGYSVFCDYSERDYQKQRAGQWVKGKSSDTFAPLGPLFVTPDELNDPQSLRLWSKVNGELRQNGWTGDMLFHVDYVVSYISQFMTLLPGDIIATGTPGGVGMGMNPPKFLEAGDLVELGIEGIGEIKQRIVAS